MATRRPSRATRRRPTRQSRRRSPVISPTSASTTRDRPRRPARLRHRPGCRPRDQSGARRGSDARRRRSVHRSRAPRGDAPATHGQLVTGSFLDYAVPRASWILTDRDDHRRGARSRGPVRSEGDRGGIDPARSRGHRQRHCCGRGDPDARPADYTDGRLVRNAPAAGGRLRHHLRPAKNARRSPTRTSGASIAGKWPPRRCSFQ